jgi:hypothetical protein
MGDRSRDGQKRDAGTVYKPGCELLLLLDMHRTAGPPHRRCFKASPGQDQAPGAAWGGGRLY